MIEKLFKYGLVTLGNYIVIFFGIYLMVDVFNFNASVSYFLLVTLIYIVAYIVYSKYVFAVEHNRKILFRFLAALIVFWILNNLLFNVLVLFFNIDIILAILFNLFVLGILRFSVYRLIVFR